MGSKKVDFAAKLHFLEIRFWYSRQRYEQSRYQSVKMMSVDHILGDQKKTLQLFILNKNS